MYVWNEYFKAMLMESFSSKFWFFLKTFLGYSPIPKVLLSLCLLSFALYVIRRFLFYAS